MGQPPASPLRDPGSEGDPVSDLGAAMSCERATDQPRPGRRSRRHLVRAARLHQHRPAHVPAPRLPDHQRPRPNGSRRTLHPHREGFTSFYLVPTNLPPGGHSFISLATGDVCDNSTRTPMAYRQLSVTIANGETVHAGAGAPASPRSAVSTSAASGYRRATRRFRPPREPPRPQPFASTCRRASAPERPSTTRSLSRIRRKRRSRFGHAPATAKASTPQASSSGDPSHSTATPSTRSPLTNMSATPCNSQCRATPPRASPSSAGA